MSGINAKIKRAIDPNNMTHPTRYVNLEKVEAGDKPKAAEIYP